MSRILGALCFALGSSAAFAQGGGFDPGDLYLYSPAIQGSSSVHGAIVRIDLAAGTSTIFVDTVTTLQHQGAIAFDPYRQRLIFCAGLDTVATPTHLWAADSNANLVDLGFVGATISSLAPTGDGRIYLRTHQPATPFAYLDAVGALHTLLDDTGTAPFKIDGNGNFDARGMIYDVPTNSLFVASPAGSTCSGGVLGRVNVRKLPLSIDGTRVVGPVDCAQFEVSTSGETPVGWSRLPGGRLLLIVDTNSSATEPRLVSVDPADLSMSAFASNGNPFAAATNAGTYSSALGKAVILETGTDKLIAFAAGEAGPGNGLVVLGDPVSSSGGSGEVASLIEIEPSPCSGAWLAYGVGKKGAGDFVPRIYGAGCPDVGENFSLTVDHVVGSAPGVLFVGLAKSNLPFLGGTLLTFPIALQLDLTMTGTPNTPGVGAITLPAALDANPAFAGISVYLQGLFADASATHGVSFTQGLEMVIGS